MKSWEDINKEELIVLLNKCWLTHDGMWFFNAFNKFGIKTANTLNLAAIEMLAPIEVARLKKIWGFNQKKIKNIEELKELFSLLSKSLIMESLGGRFNFSGENRMTIEMKNRQCFAYKGITAMKAIEQYDCGVMYRIECWFKALGLEYQIAPKTGKCTMHYEGKCFKEVTFNF